MSIRGLRRLVPALGLLFAGCLFPVQEKVDHKVCDLAAVPRDLAPAAQEAPTPTPDTPKEKTDAGVKATGRRATDEQTTAAIQRAMFLDDVPAEGDVTSRFKIPPGFPGGQVPRIDLSKFDLKTPEGLKAYRAYIDRLYPRLAPFGADPRPLPGPDGEPLTLADLQRLALANSPAIVQATALVEAARGAAIQAGAYPNPVFGVEASGAGTNGTAGSETFSIQQLIKTANKLQLGRAAASMDLANAELALRRAETDLSAQVRGGYFAVLVARENMAVSAALAKLTSDVYDIQVDKLRIGEQPAAYEPSQLRVQAVLARAALVQARNRYVSAWKQLAGSLGLPGMPATELAGRIDIPIPHYDHAKVLARALEAHTDILTARNTLAKGKFNLQLAQVTPIPDVTVQFSFVADQSGPPQPNFMAFQASIPIPIWDLNQGAIIQAQGNLVNASEQEHLTRDQLTQTLADAFERYDNNRLLLEWYRDDILPNQVRAYRGVYERYEKEAGAPRGNPPAFGDVVQAQQTLATTVQGYITTLGALWQAVVDVANVMQTDDLFQFYGEPAPTLPVCHLPEVAGGLPPLPCAHPCSPLNEPGLRGGNGDWPAAMPEKLDGQLLPPPTPLPKVKDDK
jgi:cobalt-zinc-cadmium efflux system outer membrane protein